MKTLNELYIDADDQNRDRIDKYFDEIYNNINEILEKMEKEFGLQRGPKLRRFLEDMERVIGKEMISNQ